MKQPLIQVLVIIGIVAIMFICYMLRSTLGLTTPESLGALSQIVTLAIMFVTFNLTADLIVKPKDDKTNMAIYIVCAAVSVILIMIFHGQVERLWQSIFWVLFGKASVPGA